MPSTIFVLWQRLAFQQNDKQQPYFCLIKKQAWNHLYITSVKRWVGGGGQILMFADMVGGWGRQNADVSKKKDKKGKREKNIYFDLLLQQKSWNKKTFDTMHVQCACDQYQNLL